LIALLDGTNSQLVAIVVSLFFVPQNFANPSLFENDGYVITHFHDESNGFSKFLVLDAHLLMLETVAYVKLPFRVPYGFHSLFVKDERLAKQKL